MPNRRTADIVWNQVPLTLPPETTVRTACKRMYERRVGAVLVTDGTGRPVGIFTGRDAVRFLTLARVHRRYD